MCLRMYHENFSILHGHLVTLKITHIQILKKEELDPTSIDSRWERHPWPIKAHNWPTWDMTLFWSIVIQSKFPLDVYAQLAVNPFLPSGSCLKYLISYNLLPPLVGGLLYTLLHNLLVTITIKRAWILKYSNGKEVVSMQAVGRCNLGSGRQRQGGAIGEL